MPLHNLSFHKLSPNYSLVKCTLLGLCIFLCFFHFDILTVIIHISFLVHVPVGFCHGGGEYLSFQEQ